MSFRIINPPSLGEPRGWNNGMLAEGGRVLFIAGQTATPPGEPLATGDLTQQFAAALAKVLAVVAEAGGGPGDIGRLTVYVSDLDAYRAARKPLGEAYRALMGRHYPAMALVEVSGLVEEGTLVEIEATAILA